tara:strand:- start:54715 stop:55173 length:459 start_codon:yes stop_codon:yes gene_type:complete
MQETEILSETVEQYKYLLQDPETYIDFGINVGFSFLALLLYIVIKVWVIRSQLNTWTFIKDNSPFWIWHTAATVILSAVTILVPTGITDTLLDFGIAVKEEASFFTIGYSLASMAYGPKKREMLDQLKQARDKKITQDFIKKTGVDPNKPLI